MSELLFLPRDVSRLPERVALVVDVIRATTMFERGAHSVALANDVLSARNTAQQQMHNLSIGEVTGLPPEDFAYGNSAVALLDANLQQRSIIFSTTNGTRALVAAANAAGVVAACLRNGRAAVAVALEMAQALGADITIVCAGRAGGTQQGLDER